MSLSPHSFPALSDNDIVPVRVLSYWGSHCGGGETPVEGLPYNYTFPIKIILFYEVTPPQGLSQARRDKVLFSIVTNPPHRKLRRGRRRSSQPGGERFQPSYHIGIIRFSWFGCGLNRFVPIFPEQK